MPVLTVPQTFLFLNGTVQRYTETRVARLLVNWAAGFAKDSAVVVDATNFSADVESSFALLLSEKDGTPKIWGAIERVLNRADIHFYISRDRELQKKLVLHEFPGIYAFHGGRFTRYSGRLDIRSAVRFLQDTFVDIKAEI
jgi:hypothetical protein